MSSTQPPPGESSGESSGEPPPYGAPQPAGQAWGTPPSVPPGQPPPYGAGPPEWLSSGSSPTGGAGGGRRRGLVIGGAAAALTLLVGGGAFAAYQLLDSGGTQPAAALPGNAIGYTRLDIDPSADQKIALLSLLRRLPEFEEQTGISSDREDLRQLIVERFLADSDCDQLSYDDDFAPWVGDRAGFAVVPVDGEFQPVVTIQVTDQGRAQDAVGALSECSSLASAGDDSTGLGAGEAGTESGIEFVGDYMLIAQTAQLAADFADEAESAPLSDDADFIEAMDALGAPGVASFWVDIDALREQLQLFGGTGATFAAALQGLHSYSGAFRAGSDYLEVSLQVDSDMEVETEDNNPVVDLPESTLATLSISNGGPYVDQYWESFQGFLDSAEPGSFDRAVTAFEAESGLMLPEDLSTVLGDNVTMALDSAGLTPQSLQSPAGLAGVGVGVRFLNDPAALQDVVGRVKAKLEESGTPFPLATTETDDGLVVATNQAYADSLAEGGDLGSSEAFQTAAPDADSAEGVLYVDLDKVEDVATSFEADEAAILEPMRAFGMTLQQGDDGYSTSSLRLTFD